MKNYLRLMRVHHWIKNILIAIPLVFSKKLIEPDSLVLFVLGFMLYSMTASIIYIVNDIRDAKKDSMHPVKCKRPIASGAVSQAQATVLVCAVLITALGFGFSLYKIMPWHRFVNTIICVSIYLVLNFAYSFGLKKKPLVDIALLVCGFVIRVLYGAILINVEASHWLTLTVIAGAFFFAFGKRRNELSLNNGSRTVLKYYTKEFLDKNMYVCLALLNTFYALWSIDTLSENGSIRVWTVPVVMLICMRYSMDVEGESDGDPVEVLLHDKLLIIMCIVYAIFMFVLLYIMK